MAITTGTVRLVLVKVRANRYSFQALMNASRPVVTRAGIMTGNSTRNSVWRGLAPSTRAASSSSPGMSRTKLVSTQTVKGMVKIRYVRIRPTGLLYRPRALIRVYRPDSTAICGKTLTARMTYMMICLPLKRKRPRAYAANEPISRLMRTEPTATIREYSRPRWKFGLANTWV